MGTSTVSDQHSLSINIEKFKKKPEKKIPNIPRINYEKSIEIKLISDGRFLF